MPIVVPDNSFLLAIDKQTNEATVSSTADYSVAAYSSTFQPRYDERRVEVTDAASIQGDAGKGPTWWDGEAEFPAYGDSLGRFLQALWPTDTISGAGPYTHTYTGLGGTQSWIAIYREWPGAGAFEETYGKGQATAFGITCTADETPARIRFAAMGQAPTVAAYSATLADDLADGYFTLQASGAKIELDYDTPNVNPAVSATNVQSISLNVDRNAAPMPTADGLTVSNISSGKVAPTGTMSLLYADWDAYRASYYGAVAGTTASATVVTGAIELTLKHTAQATWELRFYVPSVQFKAESPVPSPAGNGLVVPITLNIQKPSTGDHIQPVLINSTTPGY